MLLQIMRKKQAGKLLVSDLRDNLTNLYHQRYEMYSVWKVLYKMKKCDTTQVFTKQDLCIAVCVRDGLEAKGGLAVHLDTETNKRSKMLVLGWR